MTNLYTEREIMKEETGVGIYTSEVLSLRDKARDYIKKNLTDRPVTWHTINKEYKLNFPVDGDYTYPSYAANIVRDFFEMKQTQTKNDPTPKKVIKMNYFKAAELIIKYYELYSYGNTIYRYNHSLDWKNFDFSKRVAVEDTADLISSFNFFLKKWFCYLFDDIRSPSYLYKELMAAMLPLIPRISLDDYDDKIIPQLNHKLNCQNGIIDLLKKELIPHSEQHYFTYKSPITYQKEDQNKKFNTIQKEILERVLPNDSTGILYLCQIIGQIVVNPPDRRPVMLCLIGTGRNGKGVICELIRRCIGEDSIKPYKTKTISHDYYLAEIKDKKVLIQEETNGTDYIKAIDTLKDVCSGGRLEGRSVYKKPQKFRSQATPINCFNKLPLLEDNQAMFSRVVPLMFHQVFDHTPPDEMQSLWKKVNNEIPQFVFYCIEKYYEGVKNNNLLDEKDIKGRILAILETTDMLRIYCKENIRWIDKPNEFAGNEKRDSVFQNFKEWAGKNFTNQYKVDIGSQEFVDKLYRIYCTNVKQVKFDRFYGRKTIRNKREMRIFPAQLIKETQVEEVDHARFSTCQIHEGR